MTPQRIAPQALYQEVAERLRQRIFAHELPPGQPIDELGLAAEYGISRTPLREALKVLAAEGLVTLIPRRGAFVSQISASELDAIFDVLAVLEGHAARRAAERLDEGAAQRLRRLHQRLEETAHPGAIDEFFEANQAFHAEVLRLANNPFLSSTIQDLRQKIRLSRHHSLYDEGRLERSLQEHRELLAALLEGEAAAAERCMREHLRSGREAIAHLRRDATPTLDTEESS
ncbi:MULTISPECIES: GntR family transcriptional regulator [Tepidiphilus]|uniref:FCD domain-containing protein n=1 Tax=Tepidiphilus baoligensis TaxID=2698687 RepID=A0ABX1QNI7_9PROT|nr:MULTISPECIES: GntR family transcriptional regulator [Tepidiphilus]NMH16831.1 FCD domain-containing protein [Tepidiphilus baoligensis]